MTAVVTAAEMRAAEARTVASGISEHELMRRAGEQISDWIDRTIERSGQRHAVAVVGPGNNGGDALVSLALLQERGWRCSAMLLGREILGDLPASQSALNSIAFADAQSLDSADVILDGVFGIGSRTALPGNVKDTFASAHQLRLRKGTPLVAIDVPSGIDCTSGSASPDTFKADVTLCIGLVKRGLIREPAASRTGELVVLDIGIHEPPGVGREQLIDKQDLRSILVIRSASAHKSDSGTVLVVSGAQEYYGAPRLAAAAAMRAGAGLVALATPNNVVPVVASQLPEAVFVGLSADSSEAIHTIESFVESRGATLRSLVIGPGIGTSRFAKDMMGHLFDRNSTSHIWNLAPAPHLVLDADALNWLSVQTGWSDRVPRGSAILTPHAGEMSRLLGVSREDITADPYRIAADAAREWGQHVVLKVGYTTVASPDGDIWISPRAVPELATAGTGDVLSGLIGGLLAQGNSSSVAARAAVWIGAQAGKSASSKQSTQSVVATDVVNCVGRVMMNLLSPAWRA